MHLSVSGFRWCAVTAAVAVLVGAVGADAVAASPPPINTEADLADHIRTQFARRYVNGSVGNDWCYNVETERGYSYWYYNLGKGLTAQKIRSTARIQATYDDGIRKYASVFIGLQIDDASLVPFGGGFDLNSTSRTPLSGEAAKPKDPPQRPELWQKFLAGFVALAATPLDVPDKYTAPEKTSCMSLGQFLKAYGLPNNLEVQANTVFTEDHDSFEPNYDIAARWWMFAGRGHQVFNITSYPVKVSWVANGKTSSAIVNMVVGFGGGAGP